MSLLHQFVQELSWELESKQTCTKPDEQTERKNKFGKKCLLLKTNKENKFENV